MKTGIIYGYTNLESGKMYIGKTLHPKQRWKDHRYGKYKNDWHKDYKNNPDKYEYSVIEYDVPEDKLNEREIFWISFFDSYNNGYNLTPGGDGMPKGYKHTDEWKHNQSIKMSGKNNPFYGKHHSEETKQKISIKNSNPPLERRKKISDHHADVSGKNNPMYGKRGELSPMYGRKWFNNGEISKFCFECPEGFTEGRLKCT